MAASNPDFEHFFRRESGNMVSALVNFFGLQHLDLVEDVVQESLCAAMEQWKFRGWPGNPSGWLYTAAKNRALDVLRRERLFREKVGPNFGAENRAAMAGRETTENQINRIFTADEIEDEVLRMLFACTHPALPPESQLVLMLRYVCGFGSREAGRALLMKEETANKRLYRSKSTLKEKGLNRAWPPGGEEIESVCTALYLLFNEGYHSSHPELAVREDLCYEAMRLALMLHRYPHVKSGTVAALVALMCFHAARIPSRLGSGGDLILLEDQNRTQWDADLISEGLRYLEQSKMDTGSPSRYHLEAGIAACHCVARDVESTDWRMILDFYNQLLDMYSNPIVALNRALALAQVEGPQRALEELERLKGNKKLTEYPYYYSALGEMHYRLNGWERARYFYREALNRATNDRDKKILRSKLGRCEEKSTQTIGVVSAKNLN